MSGIEPPSESKKESHKGHAVYLAFRAVGSALAMLPAPAAQVAGTVVGDVMGMRPSGPRDLRARHIRRILASSTPNCVPDEALVRRLTARSFRAYARYWVEGARLPTVSTAEVNERMVVDGMEHLVEHMARGKGVILALPHVGSWEWGGAFLASQGYPMTCIAEVVEPPELFEWFVEVRAKLGLTILPLGGDSGAEIVRALHAGKLVGLISDRDIVGNGVPVTFFGETTTMPAGPATLASRTGASSLSAVVYSGPGRDHTGIVTPPFDTERRGKLREDVGRITQDIAHCFETMIRRAPEQWHLYQPLWPSDHTPDHSQPHLP